MSNSKYGWPILRYCEIFLPFENFELQQAENVAKLLSDKSGCRIENYEGPTVIYPEKYGTINGAKVEVGKSITICRAPNRSKIWLRTSYHCNSTQSFDPNQMDREALEEFFNKASSMCEKKSKVLARKHNKIMYDYTGDSHTSIMRIKIAAANLGTVSKHLKSGNFSMKPLFNDVKQSELLSDLLYMTYGEDVNTFERYNQLSKDYKWFSVIIHGKGSYIGLYSKHDHDGCTDLIGLVHEKSNNPDMRYKRARNFSRHLLQDISLLL
jgi:hypothetical protein